MTVAELRSSMSNAEYVEWVVFLAKRAQREQLERRRAEWQTKR